MSPNQTQTRNVYGWKRQNPDQRDKLLYISHATKLSMPSYIDLRSMMPSIYDQGQLGACTANAIAAVVEFTLRKQNLAVFLPSRLFIYYNERALEGTVDSDAGADLRDGFKTLASQGVCPEIDWPYDISKFAQQPSENAYLVAGLHTTKTYLSVSQDLLSLKGCLALRYPFVFGFTVYESFESDQVANSGVVPMPKTNEAAVGGHAVCVAGYNDKLRMFWCRNSWGSEWGLGGYFWMPYEYLLDSNLSSDFWTIRQEQMIVDNR